MTHTIGQLPPSNAVKACHEKPAIPHPVDMEVGRRIRLRRQQLRLSQTALGAGIGTSFQQVQKYERGTNRVATSVLYQIAAVLDVPMGYFFDTLPRPDSGRSTRLEQKADIRADYVATEEGQRLIDSFLTLPKQLRPRFMAILTTLNSLQGELDPQP